MTTFSGSDVEMSGVQRLRLALEPAVQDAILVLADRPRAGGQEEREGAEGPLHRNSPGYSAETEELLPEASTTRIARNDGPGGFRDGERQRPPPVRRAPRRPPPGAASGPPRRSPRRARGARARRRPSREGRRGLRRPSARRPSGPAACRPRGRGRSPPSPRGPLPPRSRPCPTPSRGIGSARREAASCRTRRRSPRRPGGSRTRSASRRAAPRGRSGACPRSGRSPSRSPSGIPSGRASFPVASIPSFGDSRPAKAPFSSGFVTERTAEPEVAPERGKTAPGSRTVTFSTIGRAFLSAHDISTRSTTGASPEAAAESSARHWKYRAGRGVEDARRRRAAPSPTRCRPASRCSRSGPKGRRPLPSGPSPRTGASRSATRRPASRTDET